MQSVHSKAPADLATSIYGNYKYIIKRSKDVRSRISQNVYDWIIRSGRFWNGKLNGISAILVIYKALCFDVAQGQMNGAPNETRTHSCRFASPAC